MGYADIPGKLLLRMTFVIEKPDIVFQTDGVRIYKSKVKNVIFDTDGIAFDERAIGKSVFLYEEQAEKALEGLK